MFNLFKKKYKRSDWLSGLISAEKDLESSGYEHCRWALLDVRSYGLDYYIIEYTNGYEDYLDYYENNLK